MGWIKVDANEDDIKKEKGSDDNSRRHTPIAHQLEDVYIPEKEIEYLKEVYSKTIVQDFEDFFHMSDTERREALKGHDDLYQYQKKRVKCVTLSEFVRLWREAIVIIDDFARSNMAMAPDKFKEMAIMGEIEIGGLTLPEFVGKKKCKDYNWEYIGEYIVDLEKDPDELDEMVRKKLDYTGDDDDVNADEIPEDILEIVESTGENGDMSETIELGDTISNKEKRRIKKIAPALMKGMRDMDNARAKNARMIARTQNRVEDDDFRWLRRYNKQRGAEGKIPEFHGDMMNQKDVDAYLAALDDYAYDAEVTEYNGRVYVNDDMKLLEAKQVFEYANWDVRKVYRNREEEKKQKEKKKKEKKKEKEIKKLLINIQQRKKSREQRMKGMPMGRDIEELRNASKKDKKRNKKKKKNALKKKKRKYKRILEDATVAKRYKNIKAYAKEMEDMSWGK